MTPVSNSSALVGPAYEVAVTKKVLANTQEQGKQALALIQSAVPPTAAAPEGPLGRLLNVRA